MPILRRSPMLHLAIALALAGACAALWLGSEARLWAQQPPPPPPATETRRQLEAEIAATARLLGETHARKQRSHSELRILERELALRQALIATLAREAAALDSQIATTNDRIAQMTRDMGRIRAEYGRAAVVTYKSLNRLAMWLKVLGAANPAEAYYRVMFFRQFSRYRKAQLGFLARSRDYLTRRRRQLDLEVAAHGYLLLKQQAEADTLGSVRAMQQTQFQAVAQAEYAYRIRLSEQERDLKLLINHTDAAFGVPPASLPPPPAAAPAPVFDKLRGKLPWPVEAAQAVVVSTFGKQADDEGFETHEGITLRVPQGTGVQAVAAGTVTGVSALPTGMQVVILAHGKFRSVYANLRHVMVQPGADVAAGTPIGTVATDPRSGETLFDFMVYKLPNAFLNPLLWLVPQ